MSRALRATALMMPLALLASGCLFESTLDAKGGGTVRARYKLAKDQTVEQQKKVFTSSTMTVSKASLEKDNVVDIEATFTDVTKINSAPIFKSVQLTVSKDEKAGTTTLTAKQVNRNPAKLPDAVLEYFGNEFAYSLTLPGEVVKSNGEAKGNTVTWKMPLTRVLGEREVPFEVTWKTPPADAAAAGK